MSACFCTGACKLTGKCPAQKEWAFVPNIPDDGLDFYLKSVMSKIDVITNEHRGRTAVQAVEQGSGYHQLGRKWVKVGISR